MTTPKILVLISGLILVVLASCTKCEECKYVVENSNGKTEDKMGEYCGDEIKALEKKEHYDPLGQAYVECR